MITWAERITELEATGKSLTEIAKDIGSSQQALSELKQGRSKEPRGMVAVRLHELHERECAIKKKPAVADGPKRRAA